MGPLNWWRDGMRNGIVYNHVMNIFIGNSDEILHLQCVFFLFKRQRSARICNFSHEIAALQNILWDLTLSECLFIKTLT